jgi:hypothetical protein
MIIRKKNIPFISAPIDTDMNPRFDMVRHLSGNADIKPNSAFMFTFKETDNLQSMTWCLRFASEPFVKWKDQFTIHLWEGKNRTSYSRAKSDEQRYIQEAFEDVEMTEPDNADLGEAADSEDEDRSSEAGDSGQTNNGSWTDDDETVAEGQKKHKNEQLAVGYKNDLSFVTNGDKIGVFTHDGERIRHRTTIDRVRNLDGRSFSPQRVCV